MSWLAWVAVSGALLLVFAIALDRLPVSTSALYLVVGVALGPVGLGVLALDVEANAGYVERVAEVAVVVALFTGGLKLRLGLRDRAWHAALLLAGPVMLVSIGAVAMFVHLVFGLPLPVALVLGAILAPTDPVLAGAVSVDHASDHDRVRYALSAEAGLNDGTAFPFVVLGVGLATHGVSGSWIARWFVLDVLWAVPAALAIGYVLGRLVGRFAIRQSASSRDSAGANDFFALALIAISYAAAEAAGTWGFLAVFAAGVGLRAAELRVVLDAPHPVIDADATIDNAEHPPAEQLVAANEPSEALAQPAVAAGVLVSEILSFGNTVERLVEIVLVVGIGTVLVTHWDVRAVPIALVLFLVIRPLAAFAALGATDATATQRWMIGWFGIRGIGSLFYLAYVLAHGDLGHARELMDLTVSVIAMSVLAHGVTAKPLQSLYRRSRARLRSSRAKVTGPRS